MTWDRCPCLGKGMEGLALQGKIGVQLSKEGEWKLGHKNNRCPLKSGYHLHQRTSKDFLTNKQRDQSYALRLIQLQFNSCHVLGTW